jgi:hypothetical protein
VTDPAVAAVVGSYRGAVQLVRAQTASYAAASWGQLQSYRDADIAALVGQLVPFMAGARQHTATLTDAYLAAVAARALDRPAAPVGVPADVVDEENLRGVDAETVYTRAGVTVWTALANGDDIEQAASSGLSRLQAMLATDLQLAMTHSARYVMTASPHVVGYERVTDGHCCDLCELAADRVYHKADLLPIHAHCSCTVEPLFQTGSAVRVPVSTTGETSGQDDGDRPIVHMHGEIGPVLAVRGQHFTGPSDI